MTEQLNSTELNILNLLHLTTLGQKVSSGGNKQIPYILFGVIKYLLQLDCENLKLYILIPGATGRKIQSNMGKKRGIDKLEWNFQKYFQFSSVQFSRSVESDSLRPHEL